MGGPLRLHVHARRARLGGDLGIIGFGRIGRAMAARARGFNMKVLYSDAERATAEDEQRLGVEFRDMDALLAESDFVSLHVPYSKATHHLIDERTLKAMKKSAILVNTSRGPVVDEAALAKALKEGWIAAQDSTCTRKSR